MPDIFPSQATLKKLMTNLQNPRFVLDLAKESKASLSSTLRHYPIEPWAKLLLVEILA